VKGSKLIAALAVAAVIAPAADAAVRVYPSSQTIPPGGAIAGGGGATSAALNTAIGEREGVWVVATGAKKVAATVDRGTLGAIHAGLYFGHWVSFGGRAVADALLEWDGSERDAEQVNQPIYLQVFVPQGTAPGIYRGSINVYTDGKPNPVPFSVHVFPVTLPAPGAPGNFHTSFHLAPETYVNKAATLYQHNASTDRVESNTKLYAFLAAYRISPSSWGFGEPKTRNGYEPSTKWWLDAAGNMKRQIAAGPFSAMRIPISSNRTSVRNRIAGLAYSEPDSWCDYLKNVRAFWDGNGWLQNTLQYVYGLDEPGLEGLRLVANQGRVVHNCWPGGKSLTTANPSATNKFLYDGKNDDDLDIWVVLSRRFYGKFTVPAEQQKANRARENYTFIGTVRKRGKSVWSYTYSGSAGTPGFAASEPLSNPRMFLLWNALEGTDGALYGQGTTNYTAGNPLESVGQNGEYVLLYPGDKRGPIASARLEQIRDGIEDATLFSIVRRKRGIGTVRAILGGAGLFSATARGVRLACNLGCEVKNSTTYSWPTWSRSARTPAQIEVAKLNALKAAS
jgi:hypothetical protein